MGLRNFISGFLSTVGGDWKDDPQKVVEPTYSNYSQRIYPDSR